MRQFQILTLGIWIIFCHASLAQDRPNILWITSEDNGPQLGCYGDDYATTPHLDALAKRGMLYRKAWSNAPVCSPARTTLISGLYPPSTGAEHMRSQTRLPSNMKMYPQYLRDAGYYCTNNRKKDYNLEEVGTVWDASSGKAHWRGRKEGQPFFAIFNFTVSHESQLRKRPHTAIHDPSKVRVPAYHPDTPEVRQDWAQYYDKITEMDTMAGRVLAELEADGLAENTIIFYYGDHGSGMPRNKRWPYNSGLSVPFIVSVPEKFKDLAASDYQVGGESNRLISFVDLAPTLMSLIGQQPKSHFQGHAFMGRFQKSAPDYAYGFRGRMDERYDLVRSVRDQDFIYIRHFMPHKIYGQYIDYMFKTPTTAKWYELFQQGKLTPAQSLFWQRKPVEELYDLRTDRDEINNLAKSEDHKEVMKRFRKELRLFQLKIRDVGLLPEEEIHSRSINSSPYEVGQDPDQFPLKEVRKAAIAASNRGQKATEAIKVSLAHHDSAVRYWGAMGFVNRGRKTVTSNAELLRNALNDPSFSVRVLAAEALGKFGPTSDLQQVRAVLIDAADLEKHNVWVAMLALNAIDELGPKAAPLLEQIRSLPQRNTVTPQRYRSYIPSLIKKIVSDLE
ncbi:sulfatase-like hydrolase/transferase [Verrucomicrobia bacterium]|jgi:arylsulfatase A-like enzyme|nr:sulfatase-like hydrolase/transferase [Verrucomicrobiota bacterium]MDB4796648.1 sulfatase-like hydrolase/transferase [bacterium]